MPIIAICTLYVLHCPQGFLQRHCIPPMGCRSICIWYACLVQENHVKKKISCFWPMAVTCQHATKLFLRHVKSHWLTLTPVLQRILERWGDARNYFLVFLANDKKKKKDLAKNHLYSRIVKLWKHWRITRRYLWIPAFHQLSKDYFNIRDKIHVSSFITFTYFIYHELKMHSVNLHPPPPNTNWGGWVGSFQNNWGHP